MNYSRKTLNLRESSQPLRDPRQITFAMFNRFWSLSKNPFTHPPPLPSPPYSLFLMNNIRLHGIPTKIKWKIQTCFTLYFKFWEGTSVKSYKIQGPVFYFLFYVSFYISRYHFYNFLKLHSNLSEKDLRPKFSLFNGFSPLSQPQPL